MTTMFLRRQIILSLWHKTCSRTYAKYRNPFTRTVDVISKEIKSGFKKNPFTYPEHADVVVIGGGFLGLSVAYWLKTRAGDGLSVVVLEKDIANVNSHSTYSHGVISQHFSLPENIFLSQYSAEFLRNIKDHFKADVDVKYHPQGSLLLASDKYADKLEYNITLQKEHGINNRLLTIDEIKNKFPWVNTSGIKLGCLSSETVGTFDAQVLLRGLIQKTQDLGVMYLNAEVTGFEMDVQRDFLMEGVTPGTFERINRLLYKNIEGEEFALKFASCVVAGGSESSHTAKLAKIGSGDGLLTIPLPIEKREYNVYSIANTENNMSFGLGSPLIMDTSGLWLRGNGLYSNLISGLIPSLKEDLNLLNSEIFNSCLYHRFPNCQNKEISVLGTEYIDCNTYDDTGILGPHPYHTNLIFVTGFGRQGVFHSPGIGKAVAEIIIDGQYSTIDLTRFGFDRLLIDEPLIEFNVY